MKKKIIAINLSLLLLLAPASFFAKSFTDLSKEGKTAWAYKYVDELSNKGILNGYEDGSFKPNNPVSFLETMQILKTVLNPSEDELQKAKKCSSRVCKCKWNCGLGKGCCLLQSLPRHNY